MSCVYVCLTVNTLSCK